MLKNVDGKLYFNLDTGQGIIDCLSTCDKVVLDFQELKSLSNEFSIPALEIRNQLEEYITRAIDKIEDTFEFGQVCTPSPWCPFQNSQEVIYISNPNMITHMDLPVAEYRKIDFEYRVEKTEYYTLYCYRFNDD